MSMGLRYILAFSLFLQSFTAVAQEQPSSQSSSVDIEVISEQIEVAKTKQTDEKIEVRLENGLVYEFAQIPDVEEMKQALGLKLTDDVKKEILEKGGSIEEANPLEAFHSLSDERKEKFLEVRKTFLISAARILNKVKFAAGAGSLVGNAFTFLKVKTKKLLGKTVTTTPRAAVSFQERSNLAVRALLQSIDYKLWTQAPLVIDSNEIGVSLSAGIIAETGMGRKGLGGLQEIGFSLGYNKTTKAFVFEVFHNSEGFDNTRAAVSVLGLVGKAGMVISRRNSAVNVKGYSFYPPAVPAYSMSFSEYFAAGISSGIGLPPPPLADLLTYTNRFERTALIRITVSPIVKGFVRLSVGDLRASARLVVMPVVDVVRTINDKVVRLVGRNRCERVFL